MSQSGTGAQQHKSVVHDEVVAAGRPWGRVIGRGQTLQIIDLEGQQAVDFLCFDAADRRDRYSATNTIKVQKRPYIGLGSVLYSDRGAALFTVVADTLGDHDTLYGCCSNANNRLRYRAGPGPNCYDNFAEILARFGLDESAIVPNINFFMQVPFAGAGPVEVAADVSPRGASVTLRAERDTLAALSNCPQMHNPCNNYNPTPIRVIVRNLGSSDLDTSEIGH
jgi:uncharacterized protein